MLAVRILLVAFCVWFVTAAFSPFFDIYFWFPYMQSPIAESIEFQRALTVRSAWFLTLVYFIVNYLRQRKPLSSVVPILTFCVFFSLFRTAYLVKHGGPNTEWLIVLFALGLSTLLHFEYKSETNKIFKNSW